MVYGFLSNMWIMRRIDENYLDGQVARGNISLQEKQMIMSTPQI